MSIRPAYKHNDKALNRYMNRSASTALRTSTWWCSWSTAPAGPTRDQMVLEKVQHVQCPILLAVNKADRLEDKERTAAAPGWLASQLPRARSGADLRAARAEPSIPWATGCRASAGVEHFYPEDQIADRSRSRFLAAELIREKKIMRQLGAERRTRSLWRSRSSSRRARTAYPRPDPGGARRAEEDHHWRQG